jgi:acyl homoserine lactone synthase
VTATSYRAAFFTLRSNPELSRNLFVFRTRLFVDELGWPLPMQDGVERDQFDTPSAIYCVLLHDNDQIVGCFRALSCDGPYLGKTVFPHLATARSFPASPHHIEISRFGVNSSDQAASMRLYSLMLRLALEKGASSLVAIADLFHERLLNRMGLKTVRYGHPAIVGYREDGTWILAVAGEIPIPRELSPRLRDLLHLTEQMEVGDETPVFRRQRLSA